MNPMDFMQNINDIDEQLIQSSVDFMQEDSMKKTIKRGGSALGKIILAAAMLAGILGVTAYAAEAFPSIFGQLNRKYAEIATEYPSAQEEADLYKRAAEVNETFEAKYVPLPELDESQIVIGETYYDGPNFMIAYRLDQTAVPAQFGFGPDSEKFKELHHFRGFSEEMPDSFEECLEAGLWTQEAYDEQIAEVKALGLDFIHHISALDTIYSMQADLTEEEYARAIKELKENGHVGVVARDLYIGDHILVEGEDCLRPNQEGILFGEEMTEYGRVISCDVFDEVLPEKFKDLDTLTLSLKIKGSDDYMYIDQETGGMTSYQPAGEILVPVTLTKTPQ